MHLAPEKKIIGKENAHSVLGSEYTRRDFLMGGIAAGVASGAGLGSYYFGYGRSVGNPLRIGIIGTGDEGGVLIGALNPNYVAVVAIADIRPYNVYRAFNGDQSSAKALLDRPGLMKKYGWQSEDTARSHVKVYEQDYMDLLKDSNVEAVIIALPLFIHDKVAIAAMRMGKHVLTEKLMAHSIHQCKEMARVAKETDMILATGHQRHYSILYDNAVEIIRTGLIGDLHHIRAQWHRSNLPTRDSWSPKLPDQLQKELERATADLAKQRSQLNSTDPGDIDALIARTAILEQQVKDVVVDAAKYGYEEKTGYTDEKGEKEIKISPLHELIRWRLFDRTGGGLMAELGSHQLDAAGIFVSAMSAQGEKALPLTVNAVGGRTLFPKDRDVDDHVYCTYEFPTPAYKPEDPKTHEKKVVVTYSSINGNPFGDYGEVVLGTKGTIILEGEQELMVLPPGLATKVSVVKKGDKLALDAGPSPTGGGAAASVGKAALDGPISRGYTEEIEHWAWCVRNRSPENLPRCHPKVALGDAVIALTTNIAIKQRKAVTFDPAWFDPDKDETPEGVAPDVKRHA